LPSLRLPRPSVTFASVVRSSGLLVVLVLLLACSQAVAQADLKQPADKTDVGQSIKTLSVDSQQSQAAVLNPAATQGLIRFVPFGKSGRNTSGITSFFPAGAHLTYFGGPVISNIQVIAVFWGPNVSSSITANGAIDQFYTDITNSRYFDLLSEYTTFGIVGSNGTSTSSQTIGRGSFAGKFTITPATCPESTLPTSACTVTDAQIQTELTNQINAGHLPAPQNDAHGIPNTYYAIYFPPSVTIQLDATTKSCVNGGFCAYHSNTGSNLPYGVMPDFSTGGCSVGCGGGTTLQIATGVSSHEMGEAVTDAQVGSATIFGPPLAWYDHVPPPGTDPGEIADICDPASASVSAGGHTYTVEPLFSNLQNDCVTTPPVMHMPDTGSAPGVQFNLTLTMQSSTTAATLSAYTGTVHFTSSDAAAVLPADYTFVSGDAGAHTFQFTMNTLGNQTISVADTRTTGFTGTANVNVSTVADLATTLSPTQITTTQGVTGLTFATAIRNNGGTASTGAVTVNATLGSGLTATAIAGTGWTCTLATLTCTRSDALASATNYPDVTVTFNVASNAPSSSSISASVSGGGDVDLSNNTAGATVKIGTSLSIGSSTPSATVTAGGSAQYTIAMNLGSGSSAVTFACSGLPAASSCSFSPTSLTTSGNVTMTVTTTARAALVDLPQPADRLPWLPLGALSLIVMAGLMFKLSLKPRRKLAIGFATCALLLIGILAGCGGGGGTPQTITNTVVGTPAGTYTLTFTATSPSSSASSKVTLIVN
jgi:hypothetical protein